MSFDLTNKNIKDTFQNLLQKTGSEGKLYDLEGNEITDLTIGGTLTAHSYVTSESIVNTSSGSTAFGNSADDTHLFTGHITASANISSSGTIFANSSTLKGGVSNGSTFKIQKDFGGTTYEPVSILVSGGGSTTGIFKLPASNTSNANGIKLDGSPSGKNYISGAFLMGFLL